ncbi:hypothetical protein D910_03611 [Dendroctonus ponderosae]
MSFRNKLLLIKTIIRQTLAYASTLWGYAAECHLNRLQATENKLLRMAIDAAWFVRNSQIYRGLEWEPLREFLTRKAAEDCEKGRRHSNEKLRNLVNYTPEDLAPRKKRPRHQLAHYGNR